MTGQAAAENLHGWELIKCVQRIRDEWGIKAISFFFFFWFAFKMRSGCPTANTQHLFSSIHLLLTAAYSWSGLQEVLEHIPQPSSEQQGRTLDKSYTIYSPKDGLQ